MVGAERYDGKPFLRLVDSYAYWAIGELARDDEQRLEEMTPRLREVYGTTGAWHEIVAAQMGFPDTLPARLRQVYEHNLGVATERNETFPVDDFVTGIVDNDLVAPRPGAEG